MPQKRTVCGLIRPYGLVRGPNCTVCTVESLAFLWTQTCSFTIRPLTIPVIQHQPTNIADSNGVKFETLLMASIPSHGRVPPAEHPRACQAATRSWTRQPFYSFTEGRSSRQSAREYDRLLMIFAYGSILKLATMSGQIPRKPCPRSVPPEGRWIRRRHNAQYQDIDLLPF